MTQPQQNELRRSDKGATDQDSAKAHAGAHGSAAGSAQAHGTDKGNRGGGEGGGTPPAQQSPYPS